MIKTNVYVLVFFQENNAIAVVDLQAENISAIHGLGFKDWSQLRLDPSDKDGGKKDKMLSVDQLTLISVQEKVIQETFRGYPCLRYPLLM